MKERLPADEAVQWLLQTWPACGLGVLWHKVLNDDKAKLSPSLPLSLSLPLSSHARLLMILDLSDMRKWLLEFRTLDTGLSAPANIQFP